MTRRTRATRPGLREERDGRRGRGAQALLREAGTLQPPAPHGTGMPRTQSAPTRGAAAREPRGGAGQGGVRAPGRGWSPVTAPLITHLISTGQIGAVFPLLGGATLPGCGAPLGYDATTGSAVHLHPKELVLRGVLSNPNIVVTGEPGVGKSSLIAALALRLMAFGCSLLIAGDVKGEYTPLLRALDATPVRLGDTTVRLNPLDLPQATRWQRWSVTRQRDEAHTMITRWVALLSTLAQAQGYETTVTDDALLATTLRELAGIREGTTCPRPLTIPMVWRALAEPTDILWQQARFVSRQDFLDRTRSITDSLGNLCHGALAGIFDAPSTVDIDWGAPAQSLDLSALAPRGDRATAIALACLGSWSTTLTGLTDIPARTRLVVRDEVWRQLRLGTRAVHAIDADLRLSRAQNSAQILVTHKPSDLLAVGHAGSADTQIARDLMALCATKILFGQNTAIATELAEHLGLSDAETAVLHGWATDRRGRALLKLGSHPGIRLHTVLTAIDREVFDTQAALRGTPHTRGGARCDP